MWKISIVLAAAVLTGCAGHATTPAKAPVAATQAATPAISPDVKSVLADFSKAHQEKIKLGTFAGSILLPVDEPFKPFFKNMAAQQKELLAELRAWAKANNVNLAYSYSNDPYGRALKLMEQKQEAKSRASKKDDFQRDMLMHMYHDYEWQICLIDAISPDVTDVRLKAYLKKSRDVHEEGSVEITALQKKYKYAN